LLRISRKIKSEDYFSFLPALHEYLYNSEKLLQRDKYFPNARWREYRAFASWMGSKAWIKHIHPRYEHSGVFMRYIAVVPVVEKNATPTNRCDTSGNRIMMRFATKTKHDALVPLRWDCAVRRLSAMLIIANHLRLRLLFDAKNSRINRSAGETGLPDLNGNDLTPSPYASRSLGNLRSRMPRCLPCDVESDSSSCDC